MKTVLIYEFTQDGLRKMQAQNDAHSDWVDAFYTRGLLLMTGPFANPSDGYMSVFVSREAAEEFIQGDPFVADGLVSSWILRDWDEALS